MSRASELEALAGAVLCVGFSGDSPAAAPLDELAELGPGAVVLFARNVETLAQTRSLTDAVRDAVASATDRAPLVAIDQEGGRVVRLRGDAHEVPPMMAFGAAGDVELCERAGRAIAADLQVAGIDLDFAPVLDLALSAASPIGARAFGDDPERVAELGLALARGLEAGGCVATFKHFPGHGAAGGDSHSTLPSVEASENTLRQRELVPFARAIAAGARAMMSAHVVYRAFDPERPATLSPRVLTALLRGELGFTGVCFTDCMEMEAIAGTVGSAEGAVDALVAGADAVVISHRLTRAVAARNAIVAAVEDGRLRETRLQEAAERIRRLQAGSYEAPGHRRDDDAMREVARRAVTLVRAQPGALPIEPGSALTVVSFEGSNLRGAEDSESDRVSLNLALRRRGVRSELMRVPLEPDDAMVQHLSELWSTQPGRRFALVVRGLDAFAPQRAAVQALLQMAPAAIVIARDPFDLPLLDRARTLLCTYGDENVLTEALADVLAGRSKPTGMLPLLLPARAG